MIKLVLLFLTTGIALVVAVALAVGVAWVVVAIPVVGREEEWFRTDRLVTDCTGRVSGDDLVRVPLRGHHA